MIFLKLEKKFLIIGKERQWINNKKEKLLNKPVGDRFPQRWSTMHRYRYRLQHTSIPRSPVFGTERERGVANAR